MKNLDNIDLINSKNFDLIALEIFKYQFQNNIIYNSYCEQLNVKVETINSIEKIPFLPISFFKTAKVLSTKNEIEKVFISSGTTGTESYHHISDLKLYEKSIKLCFDNHYGNSSNYAFLGVTPKPKEKPNSSLIYMIDYLIKNSDYNESSFCENADELNDKSLFFEKNNIKYIIYGLSYALLDVLEKSSFSFKKAIIIETGGMKGKRKEISKKELHKQLASGFDTKKINSEYGMTELLSQSYSNSDLNFKTPKTKKLLIRDINDPFKLSNFGRGPINIIDLANINSCSFIATDDYGLINQNGFELLGRLEESDLRGCNQMLS